MGQWRDFPLPDGSYSDETRPFSQQDVVNYLPTIAERNGTRSAVKYKTAPGLKMFARIGDGPHRGAHNCEGRRFIVSGRKLYQVDKNGVATDRGTIPGTGRVTMAHNQIANGNQVLIGTIDNSYLWDTFDNTLAANGVALQSVDFLNQRFLGVDQQRRFWRHSALADGASWSDLDVYSSESSPDRIVALKVLDGHVYVFNERTIEVFDDQPTETQVYQRTVVIQRGCISGDTIVRIAGTLFFVGDDYIPYRLDGYTPVPIGTKPIASDLSVTEPRKLFGFGWEDRGYLVYYITAQNGNTWGYDVTNGRWHRRESYGLDRWRINTMVKFEQDWYAGDYSSGLMYKLEWGNVYEGCEIMPRKLRTGVLHNQGNRVQVHGFRIVAATGQPPIVPSALEDASLLDSRFLGGGVNSVGEIATSRPFNAEAVVIGTDDANVGSATTSAVLDVAVSGSSVYALVSGGGPSGIYEAARTNLASWTNVATPSLGAGVHRIAAAGGAVFVTSGTVLSKWDGTTLTTTDFGTTLSGAAGDGDVLLVIGLYGDVWKSTDGGDTFAISETFTGWNLYSIAYNGQRFVVAGSVGSVIGFSYSDDAGDSWTSSSLDPGIALQPIGLIWCGASRWMMSLTGNVAANYFFASSDNAASFAAVTLPENIKYTYPGSIAHDAAGGLTVVIGTNAADQLRCYSSSDLTTWATVDLSDTSTRSIYALYPLGAGVDTCTAMEGGLFQLRYSNDGAENWSNWRDFEAPTTGRFLQPLIARRLGMTRHRVWEIMDTSNAAQDVLAASIIVESE